VQSVGGRRVRDMDDLQAALAQRRPGDAVDVAVRRGSEQRTVRVTLGERPAQAAIR
jgi:S1-C subfamily serine protease